MIIHSIYSVPVSRPLTSRIQRGYLNANVSVYQTEGTLGSTNTTSFVITEGVVSGNNKRVRAVFERFGT